MALRRGRVAHRVIGFSRREATVRQAKARGAVNDGCTELCPDWLGESDLVVLAVPPEEVVRVAREVARLTSHSFLMTDVTSVKGPVVRALEKELPPRIRFVGSHPMAGSEKSGIEAARAALFEGAPCVVTRTPKADARAVAKTSSLWEAVGGETILMDPLRHDALVAQISHLPHLSAVGLILSADKAALKLCAGGFADTTRIALSSPALWREICLANREPIVRALSSFRKNLRKLETLVAGGNGAQMEKLFRAAGQKRRRVKR